MFMHLPKDNMKYKNIQGEIWVTRVSILRFFVFVFWNSRTILVCFDFILKFVTRVHPVELVSSICILSIVNNTCTNNCKRLNVYILLTIKSINIYH
jgi:hypothetical protein